MTEAERAAIVANVPFASHLGVVLLRCAIDAVEAEATLRPEHCTAGGTAHGGFLMAIADFAGACGAWTALPEGAKGTTTIESKTNMIGGAKVGSVLRIVSTPVHIGKRTSVWSTRVETIEGRLVSVTTQTQMAL